MRIFKHFILLTLFLVLPSSIIWSAEPDIVFLLIGQSNMAGRAHLIDGDDKSIGTTLLFDDKGEWIPATNPLNRFATDRKVISMQRIGPGAGFAAAINEALDDTRVGLVVNARGGSSIDQWMKGQPLYDNAIKRIKDVPREKFAGVIWHQGESNADDPKYIEKARLLVNHLRTDLEKEDLVFIAGEVFGEKNVNKLLNKLPESISKCAVVSAKGLKVFDGVHFDRESQLELGRRYAKAWLTLTKK